MSTVDVLDPGVLPSSTTGLLNDTSTDSSTNQAVLGTSSQAIITCNAISVAACVLVMVIYILLHRKYTRVMQRTSLVLSCAMATSDLLLHATNLVGYSYLPPGFACEFIGGFLYAFPTLLSVFYSCCIALNSQLYFVFRREPKDIDRGIGTLLKWYIITPVVLSGIICLSALGAGLYGYDPILGYCWFASPPQDPDHPDQPHMRPLIGMLTTFGGWCLLALVYLLIASSTIAWTVFWRSSDVDFGGHIGLRRHRRNFCSDGSVPTSSTSHSRWAGYGHGLTSSTDLEGQRRGRSHTVEFEDQDKAPLPPANDVRDLATRDPLDIHDTNDESVLRAKYDKQARGRVQMFLPEPRYSSSTAHSQRTGTNSIAPLAHQERPKISRRTLALRAMALRLIGYTLIPVICVLPSVVMDLLIKAYPVGEVGIPDAVTGFFDGINGLVGFFNAMLFLFDPMLLVVWAELRVDHCWGLFQKQRTASSSADHEHHDVIDVKAMAEPPLQDTKTPGTDRAVGGIRATHVGREDKRRSTKRTFEDSLVSIPQLQELDDEQLSPRVTRKGPKKVLPWVKPMGRRKGLETHHNGGSGLIIHMQVEVTNTSDLDLVQDYLRGL